MKKRYFTDNISRDALEKMILCFEPSHRLYQPGETILAYSDGLDHVGILLSGAAKLSYIAENGDSSLLENYREGDLFGEPFSLPLENYEYIVTAESRCHVVFIQFQHLITPCEKACQHHSQLISNLFVMTAQKSQELSLHINILSQPTTRKKLMTYPPLHPDLLRRQGRRIFRDSLHPGRPGGISGRRPVRHDAGDPQSKKRRPPSILSAAVSCCGNSFWPEKPLLIPALYFQGQSAGPSLLHFRRIEAHAKLFVPVMIVPDVVIQRFLPPLRLPGAVVVVSAAALRPVVPGLRADVPYGLGVAVHQVLRDLFVQIKGDPPDLFIIIIDKLFSGRAIGFPQISRPHSRATVSVHGA